MSPAHQASEVHRLNWGCGGAGAPGWINSDIKHGPAIDISCDVRDGLPLESDSIDYAVSIHALQELPYPDQIPALRELRRVLRPEGVLRLALPNLWKGVEAYRRGDREYFLIPDEHARSLGAKFIVQLVWYGYTRTPFIPEFIEELLLDAGFTRVSHVDYRQTESPFSEIVELDSRARESLFVEAVK